MKYESQEQLRQALLELHYDLLDDEEAESLRESIANDPRIAAEWEDSVRLANQLADAAQIQQLEVPEPSFPDPGEIGRARSGDHDQSSRRVQSNLHANEARNAPASNSSFTDKPSGATPGARLEGSNGAATGSPRWSWATSASIAAVAAMLGMLLIGSSYFSRLPETPQAVIRLQARQVPGHRTNADHEFRLFTSRIDGPTSAGRFPVTPASLSFAVLTRDAILFSGLTRTDAEGTGSITLPDDLVIPPDARLQVTAAPLHGSAISSRIEVPLQPTRCITYLTVDRPVYRPGETVFFRSLTLARRSLQASSDLPIRFELQGSDGAVFSSSELEGITDRGVGNGAFPIPKDAKAGAYALVAKSLDGLFPDERCEFQVHGYQIPKFRKELRFGRRSYSGGETVEADLTVSRVTGEPLADANIAWEATVDGKLIRQSTATTSSNGTCDIQFALPESISVGLGELRVTVEEGVDRETSLITIPIQLGKIHVDFYPEGGYLVEGLENRIYFAAHDSSGQTIHLEGEVIDDDGESVARIETVRDGMGLVSLRPIEGQTYRLKVKLPSDVDEQPQLPAVVRDLPVIDTGTGVFEANQPLQMTVRNSRPRSVIIQATCRGQLVGQQRVRLAAGESDISVPLGDQVGGVVRVTLLDADTEPAKPLVERLVYRRPSNQLRIQVLGDAVSRRQPAGETVDLSVQVLDESGNPAQAILGVSVVDEASESLRRRKQASLSTHFVLLSEVENPGDLELADFYLSDEPGAEQSLDLLLGTQGWRRFITPSAAESETDFRDQLIRLLELDGVAPDALQRFDNANLYASAWFQYQEGVQSAGDRLRLELKILGFVVVGVWLLAYLLHHRRSAATKLASCLLIVGVSWSIPGCGVKPAGMMVESQATESESAADGQMPSAQALDLEAPQPRTDQGPTDANDVVSAEYIDWLDEAKAAWLLRVSDRGGSDSQAGSVKSEPIAKGDLMKLMKARGLDAEGLADELLSELRFPIRQYAHRRAEAAEGSLEDFTETLYWQPLLVTDAEGQAAIRFDLSDSITTFRIRIDGHAEDGRIGSGSAVIITESPQADSDDAADAR